MYPRLRRSITPCDGTAVSTLSRIQRTGCGEKIKKEQGGPDKNSGTIIAAVFVSFDVLVSQHCD